MQAVLDRAAHQLVIGGVELHQIDAAAEAVVRIEQRRVLVGQHAQLQILGRAGQAAELARLLDGDRSAGTHFEARETRYSSFKLWLKYAKPTLGVVEVDAGAARALREAGTSLLPVGILAVHGSFQPGDAVEVAAGGSPIGKGVVSYSADELRRVAGLKSAEIREVLPRASDEAVHRDYFVLA